MVFKGEFKGKMAYILSIQSIQRTFYKIKKYFNKAIYKYRKVM